MTGGAPPSDRTGGVGEPAGALELEPRRELGDLGLGREAVVRARVCTQWPAGQRLIMRIPFYSHTVTPFPCLCCCRRGRVGW